METVIKTAGVKPLQGSQLKLKPNYTADQCLHQGFEEVTIVQTSMYISMFLVEEQYSNGSSRYLGHAWDNSPSKSVREVACQPAPRCT